MCNMNYKKVYKLYCHNVKLNSSVVSFRLQTSLTYMPHLSSCVMVATLHVHGNTLDSLPPAVREYGISTREPFQSAQKRSVAAEIFLPILYSHFLNLCSFLT